MFLWRAVGSEGEVLHMLVQKRRNKTAAVRLLRKLLKRQGIRPELLSWEVASTLQRRKQLMQRFTSQGPARQFVSTHAATCNVSNVQRQMVSRRTRQSRDAGMST